MFNGMPKQAAKLANQICFKSTKENKRDYPKILIFHDKPHILIRCLWVPNHGLKLYAYFTLSDFCQSPMQRKSYSSHFSASLATMPTGSSARNPCRRVPFRLMQYCLFHNTNRQNNFFVLLTNLVSSNMSLNSYDAVAYFQKIFTSLPPTISLLNA